MNVSGKLSVKSNMIERGIWSEDLVLCVLWWLELVEEKRCFLSASLHVLIILQHPQSMSIIPWWNHHHCQPSHSWAINTEMTEPNTCLFTQNKTLDMIISSQKKKKILLPCFTTWILIEADILFLYFSAKYTSSYCLSVPDTTSWQERAHMQRNWARSWDAFWNGCRMIECRIFYPKISKYLSKCSKQPQNFQGVCWILRVLWAWGFSGLLLHLPPFASFDFWKQTKVECRSHNESITKKNP